MLLEGKPPISPIQAWLVRRVDHLLKPFLIQMWLFVTPVIYPSSEVVPRLEAAGLPGWLIGLNPMAGAVESFRWATLGLDTTPWAVVAVSSVVAALLLVTGAVYFRSVERFFADVA